jgi:epoxide hydrolase
MTTDAITPYTAQIPDVDLEDLRTVRKFADRDHANIVSWNHYEQGSHFATRDATDLLISDIRGFFRDLR